MLRWAPAGSVRPASGALSDPAEVPRATRNDESVEVLGLKIRAAAAQGPGMARSDTSRAASSTNFFALSLVMPRASEMSSGSYN